jgi:hypothetical protein
MSSFYRKISSSRVLARWSGGDQPAALPPKSRASRNSNSGVFLRVAQRTTTTAGQAREGDVTSAYRVRFCVRPPAATQLRGDDFTNRARARHNRTEATMPTRADPAAATARARARRVLVRMLQADSRPPLLLALGQSSPRCAAPVAGDW